MGPQGWVQNHPQSHIHAAERTMVRSADHVITCSRYMRVHVANVFGVRPSKVTAIQDGIDPRDLEPVEAMASGCLCVVADSGGLRELVPVDGTVGLRFPSRDATALRTVLERVLTDDDARRQRVAEAREHVLHFDWIAVARRTAEIYDSLAAGAITPAW
jgi:Glycosyltransferase Family 4